ncbi:MAG: hypothetical protein LBT19_02920 [Candidatus Nomurabacteria bacterium]|jgi:hypothetical protein|nr:hypothetical protein [Candidatus Nomurabacteria bacterium]
MPSAYYHEFTPGFNWWYVTGPLFVLISFGIGWIIPRIRKNSKGERHVKAIFTEAFGYLVATPLALIWGVMLFAESFDGAVQYMDNTILTSADSGVYSLVFALMAMLAIIVMMWVIVVVAYCWGRKVKIQNLRRYCRCKNNLVSENRPVTGSLVRWR